MEDRLLPINALLGLLLPNDIIPPVLAEAGFQLAGLEIPARGAAGTVVIDALLVHVTTNHLVLVEAKSGSNIEADQAIRYGTVNPRDVVQSAYVTLTARTPPPTLETVYVCLAENGERIGLGIEKLGLAYPIIMVSPGAVALRGVESASDQLANAFASGPVSPAGPPPRLIPFDEESSVAVVKPYVLAVLVEAMSQRLTELSLPGLTERVTPHYGLYGRRAQGQLRRRVAEAARQVATAEPASFTYLPPGGSREGLVRILRTPEDNDARGRTQAYQAVGRQSIIRKEGKPPWHPDQLDLLAELESDDNGSGGVPKSGTQEGEK